MALEVVALDTWLYNRLTGDPTLSGLVDSRIYAQLAPPGATMPFVIFGLQAGMDDYVLGPSRYSSALVYQVKAVGQGESFSALEAIANRLDELLEGATGTLSTGDDVVWLRQSPIEYIEYGGGRQFRHMGALWRVWLI